jgi:mono/diheme cytochrome c family protein
MKTVRASSICWVLFGMLLAVRICGSQNFFTPPAETTRLIPSLEGSDLYVAYCATCHGRDGKGHGPMAQVLKSPLPDLTRIAHRNHGKFPTGRVERIISGEQEFTPAHGSREMPLWGPIFSEIVWDRDLGRVRVHNLAKYLESIQQP